MDKFSAEEKERIKEFFDDRFDIKKAEEAAEGMDFHLPEWSEIKRRAEELDRMEDLTKEVATEETLPGRKLRRSSHRRIHGKALLVAAVIATLGMSLVVNAGRVYNFVIEKSGVNQNRVKIITGNKENLESERENAYDDIIKTTGAMPLQSKVYPLPFTRYLISGNKAFTYFEDGDKKIVIEMVKQETDIAFYQVNDRTFIGSVWNEQLGMELEEYMETIADGKEAYSSLFLFNNVIYTVSSAGLTQEEFEHFLSQVYVKRTER